MEDPCSFIQDSCASDLQETHKAWRKRCRDFVEEHIIPYVSQWEVRTRHVDQDMSRFVTCLLVA